MENLYDLINKKNNLPQGRIYKKNIKGKTYFYHQFSNQGKRCSKIIKKEDFDELNKQILERLEIEKQIKEILKNGNKDIALSKSARELTGYVMKEDKVVAEFNQGNLISYNEDLCPLIIKRTKRLEPFLKYRSIDSGRTNSRILKKILNINIKDNNLISLCSYAASINDDYWFKPKHSKLKYKDISFNNDMLFDTSLKGLISIYPNKIILTPELTTNGSYEKGWKNNNGVWWLYKVGNKNEIFSELFYSRLFEKLNLPTAHYEYDGKYILSKNFAEKENFEPMVALVGDDEDYKTIYHELNKINHDIALSYLRLCFFDVVLNNVDRHNENCGIMRDKKTGKIVSLAPNYDDNLCLISRIETLPLSTNEGFLKMFVSFIKNNEEIKKAYQEIDLPSINKEIIEEVLNEINFDVDRKNIVSYILLRYKTLIDLINK